MKTGYITQFDGLRFLAIVMVMIAHWLQWQLSNPIVKAMPFAHGVILFFVLSGFLITNILLRNKEKINDSLSSKKSILKGFYARRIIRIFPIYYLILFFLYFIDYKNTHEIFPWLLTYTSNIYQSIHNVYVGDFNHFWSLAVEEQFYLFWPFLILFTPKRYLEGTIISIIFFSLLVKGLIFLFIHSWMANSYFTLSNLNSLGFGALLAYWSIYRKTLIPFLLKWYWMVFIGSIYIGLRLYSYFNSVSWYTEIIDEPLFALFSGSIIIYAANGEFKGLIAKFLEHKYISYLGKVSYGMYVYHLFVPALFWYIAPKLGIVISNKYTMFVFFFLITFILSHFSWILIEKPINKLKSRYPYIKEKS